MSGRRDATALVVDGKPAIIVCELENTGMRDLALNGFTRRRWERVMSAGQLLTTALTARVYADHNHTGRVVAGGETIWSGQLNATRQWHELAQETRAVTVYLAITDSPVRSLSDLDQAARQGHAVAARGQLRPGGRQG